MTTKIPIEEQKQNIILLRNQGLSRQEIATKLGISLSSYDRQITELLKDDLIKPVHYKSESQNEKIVLWHKEGISCKEIARRLGMTVPAVETRIKKLRLKGIITTYNKPGPKKKHNHDEALPKRNKLTTKQFNSIAHIYLVQKQYDKILRLLETYSQDYDLSESKHQLIARIKKGLQNKIDEKER